MTQTLKITSNWVKRPLLAFHDLDPDVQQDFDYVKEEMQWQPRFVQYKGEFYDALDTQYITLDPPSKMGWGMHVEPDSPLAKWDSIISETYFSGVLFKFDQDDNVVVGRYYS